MSNAKPNHLVEGPNQPRIVMVKVEDDLTPIDIDDLTPLQGELKKLSDENFNKLRNSILKKGFKLAIHVWQNGGVNYLIDGHQRVHVLKQMRKEGIEIPKVPCVLIQASTYHDAKETVLLAVSQHGKLDKQGFNDFVEGEDFEFDDLDFPDVEDDFFDTVEDEREAAEREEKEDDVPEIQENENPYGVQRGQVWKLGDHRVMCGDSTSKEDVAKLMNGAKVDLWLTDPPYNVAYVGKTKDALTIENDSMSDENFRSFLVKVYMAADSVMKPGASFYIWHADSEGYNFRGAANDIGWKIRQCLIWSKDVMVMGRQDYHWKHEPCLYGWKDGAAHKWSSDRKQTTILEFDRPKRNEIHPTMKPVALFEYQLKNNTEIGDIVLDSFTGSGTTLISCEKTQRKGYGMELDPKYVCAILRRWEEYTGKTAERID